MAGLKRIAYLGAFSVDWNTECEIRDALRRLGHDVLDLEEERSTAPQLARAIVEYDPDIFLFAKGRIGGNWDPSCHALASLIAAVREGTAGKVQVACWVFDLLAKDFAEDRFQWGTNVGELVDAFFLTDGSTAPQFKNTFVLPQGVPHMIDNDCPWDVPEAGQILFLGTAYRDRQEFVGAFRRKFGGRFRQVNDCRGPSLTRLVRSYRLCVAPYYPSRDCYWSNRLYVITGHGGLFAGPNVAGMGTDGWFGHKQYLPIARDPAAAADECAAFLDDTHDVFEGRGVPGETILGWMRRAGFEHARANCTYDVRCAKLLAHLATVQPLSSGR